MVLQLITRQQLLAELAEKYGIEITEPTLYRWIKDGIFPAPISIAPRIKLWPANTLADWYQSRIDAHVKNNCLEITPEIG